MIQSKVHNYQANNVDFKGYLAFPEASKTPKPCVLVVHDWGGCNAFAKDKAEQLAKLGYVSLAVDMYGEGKTSEDPTEKRGWMTPLIEDRAALKKRIQAALTSVSSFAEVDSENIAIMGYCFGGLCALDLARSGANIKGAVSFHGLLFPPVQSECEKIKAKILVLHGYDDPMCKPAEIDLFASEMSQRKVDWQIHAYGNTKHSFTNPHANDSAMGLKYDALAEKRSWQAMLHFFSEVFS